MKKLFILFIILIVLCGCSKKVKEPVPDPEPEPPANSEPAPAEKAPQIEDVITWLDGGWNIITNDPDRMYSVSLIFDAASKTVKILRLDDEFIVAELEPFDSYDDQKTKNDALRFKFKDASDYFKDKYGTSEYMYSSDMQYFIGYFEGYDFLFLREMGNGFSLIDTEGMGEAPNMAGDGGWLFCREYTGNSFPTLTDNEALKTKDGTFYAYCWARDDTYLLQKVDVLEQEEEWYEGTKFNTVRIIPDETEYKYTTFLYGGNYIPTYDKWIPGLVKVSVSNGEINSMTELTYLGYGAYDAD